MITNILDSKEGNLSIVLMDREEDNFIELYLEGKFNVDNDSGLQEETRIELDEYSVKMLIGYLQNWLQVRAKTNAIINDLNPYSPTANWVLPK